MLSMKQNSYHVFDEQFNKLHVFKNKMKYYFHITTLHKYTQLE